MCGVVDVLPKQPSERRVVIVLERTGFERLDYDHRARQLIKPGVAAMRWPPEESDELAVSLDAQGLAVPGAVLMQSPYAPTSYVLPDEDAAIHLALEKASTFVSLCCYLGAKRVLLRQVRDESSGVELSADGGVTAKGVRGKLGGGSKQMRQLKESMSLSATFSGGPPDVPLARSLLQGRRLDHDPVFASLVERCEYAENRQVSESVKFSVSDEVNRTLNFVLDLELPGDVPMFAKVGINRKKWHAANYQFTYDVEF